MKQHINFGVGRQRFETERRRPEREILALPVTAITTGGVTLHTVPDDAVFQIDHFMVTNYSTGTETFSLFIVPSGGSAGNSNVIYDAETVTAGNTASPILRGSIIAPASSTIEVSCSTNSTMNIILHGYNVYSGDFG